MSLFITATGTELGKTVVTAALAHQLRAAGQAVTALKPVASGVDPHDLAASDPGRILEAMGKPVTHEAVSAICPWMLKAPLAPHMAAEREGKRLGFEEILGFCEEQMRIARGPVLIEGVGGVMAPVTHDRLVIEWIAALKMPALLVAGAYLGTMSHILTAADALASRGIPLAGLVISDHGDAPVPLAELAASLEKFLPSVPITGFGPIEGAGPDWASVPDLCRMVGVAAA